MTGRRIARVALRSGLVAGGLLAGSGVAEVALRFFLPQEIGLRWYTREGIMVYVPGLRGTYIRPEFRSRIEIDSDGLRDREYAPGKEDGTFRILVLGDSLTAGLQVPVEETFCKRIERALAAERAAPRIEVVNAGISGYGTADELRYLQTFGSRWKPDVVLVAFFCGNDVKNNMTEDGLFRDGGKIQVRAVPLTAWQYCEKAARCWLASRSHLFQFFRDRLRFDRREDARPRNRQPGQTGQAGQPGEPGRREEPEHPANPDQPGRARADRTVDRVADWDLLFADPGPDYAVGWRLTLELLGRIDDVAHGLGARTAIVAIPSPWQNDPSTIAAHLAPAPEEETIDVYRPGRVVCDYAATIGVPCTDLLPGFKAAGADASYYWKLDGHFTSKAHATAASLITRFFHDHDLVPGSGTQGPAQQPRADGPVRPGIQ